MAHVSILVKSFNRPYYLDRCLRSIVQQVSGDYEVVVLDDGTPPEYLAEIARRHPGVRIERSAAYEAKVAQIVAQAAGEAPFTLRNIPTKLWRTGVEQASDIFCLLEDDIWMTQPLNIDTATAYMRERQIVLAKMYWGGDPSGFEGKLAGGAAGLREYKPVLSKAPEWLIRMLLFNKFKTHSILSRLGLLPEGILYHLPFYGVYSVAAAMFNKEYWLKLWPAEQQKANEVYQLTRALNLAKNHAAGFAKTEEEVALTSFITSATNSYAEVKLDVFAFNHHLNQAWLRGELDAMHNYPRDFDVAYLRQWLDAAQDPRATYTEWLKWIDRFKEQYRHMGCVVD